MSGHADGSPGAAPRLESAMEEERSAFTCRVSDEITTLSVTIGEGQLGATLSFAAMRSSSRVGSRSVN